jgi:methionyl-tRNA synthetase
MSNDNGIEVTPAFEGTFAEIPATVVELPPNQNYNDFCKFDIRTGTITVAEKIKKKDRLLHLEVYLGADIGTRTIVAGIAEHFTPEFLIGLQVMVVTNLEPRSLGGFTSHGMILAGKDLNGKLSLAGCMGMPDGTEIG